MFTFKRFVRFNEALDQEITNAYQALDYLSRTSGVDLSSFKDKQVPQQQFKTITQAFRKASMAYHPDRNPGNAQVEAIFKSINASYELLQKLSNSNQPFGQGQGSGGSQNGATSIERLAEMLADKLQNYPDREVGISFENVQHQGNKVQAMITRGQNANLFGEMPHDENFYNISFRVTFTVKDPNEYDMLVEMLNKVAHIYGPARVLSKVNKPGDIYNGSYGARGNVFGGVEEYVHQTITNMVQGVQTGTAGLQDHTKKYFEENHFKIKGIQGDKNNFEITFMIDQGFVQGMEQTRQWMSLMHHWINDARSGFLKRARTSQEREQMYEFVEDVQKNNPYLMSGPVEIHFKVQNKKLTMYGKYCKYKWDLTLGDTDWNGQYKIKDELGTAKIWMSEVVAVEAVTETARRPGPLQQLAQLVIKIGQEGNKDPFRSVEMLR